MIIQRKWSKTHFYSYVAIAFCFEYEGNEIVFPTCAHFFYKNCMNMSFHGNQIGDIVAILILKTFY